jgi:hypothetical protein
MGASESIVHADLTLFFNNREDVLFCNEDLGTNKPGYYDPLVYLFRCKENNIDKLCFTIQFKIHDMGVRRIPPNERNNLIPGTKIYVLKNEHPRTSKLFSIICSDAVNFGNYFTPEVMNDIDWHNSPFIVLNPKLNPKPSIQNLDSFKCIKTVSSVQYSGEGVR